MPAERLSMRKARDVLRPKHMLGMSLLQISGTTGIGKTVLGEYVLDCGRRFHPPRLTVYSIKLLLCSLPLRANAQPETGR